jgi:peptide/nickel transport system permease protein
MAAMLIYVVRRVLATVPVLLIVALFVSAILHLTPGDPAVVIAGHEALAETVVRIREHLGLDTPFHVQFGKWLVRVLQGDLGSSIFTGIPVVEMIAQRLEPTMCLAATSIIVALVIALPLGVLAAARAGSWVDYAAMTVAVLGFSTPVFIIAYIFVSIFSIQLGWLPVQGFTSLRDGILPFLASIALPSLALGILTAALIARVTRASLLRVLGEDYIRTARAKGLGRFVIIARHALKNAAPPIVTVIGLSISALLGGVIVTESVFNIPGIGRLVADAVLQRDYPVVQGVTLMFSFVYVVVNLLVDLSYVLFDPRIRYA